MTSLRIGVRKYLDGENIDRGVIARVIPLDRRSPTKRNVILPIGDAEDTTKVDVVPGKYLVQATLPSGSVLMKEVDVEAGHDVALLLDADRSPHEHLSWQHLSKHSRVFERYAENGRLASNQPELAAKFGHSPRILERAPHPWNWEAFSPLVSGSSTRSSPTTIADIATAFEAGGSGGPIAARPGDEADSYIMSVVSHMDMSRDLERPLYFAVVERGETIDVVSLPLPWMMGQWGKSRQYNSAHFDLAVPRHPSDPVSATVRDSRFGTMLAYIANGALPTAAALFASGDAVELLMDKLANPFAAVAGAYVLIETETTPTKHKEWHDWLDNLAKWFPWLPDGAVLAAWHRLHRDDDPATAKEAIEWLRVALHRGLPVFAPVLRCLNDALTMVVDDPDMECEDLAETARVVGRVAGRTCQGQPFTVLRFGGAR